MNKEKTDYATFAQGITRDIARCFGIPFGIAAGGDVTSNYSSSRISLERLKSSQADYETSGVEA